MIEKMAGFIGDSIDLFKSAQSEYSLSTLLNWTSKSMYAQHNSHLLKLPEYLTLDLTNVEINDKVVLNLKLPVAKGGNSVSMEREFILSNTLNDVLKYATERFRELGLPLDEPVDISSEGKIGSNRVLKVVGQDNFLVHGDFMLAHYDFILST